MGAMGMTANPQSLLTLAGVAQHPSPAGRAALVVIDAQREYLTGGLRLDGIEAAVAELRGLLSLARRHGLPVFHVVHLSDRAGALFDRAGPYAAIIPGLEPWDGEAVVAKALPNAFAGTDLYARIQAAGRGEIVLAGFMTHMCVSTTARAALDHGYRTTIVAAAAATRDIPDPAGGVIPAAALHRTELAALADRFAVVVADSATLARAWA